MLKKQHVYNTTWLFVLTGSNWADKKGTMYCPNRHYRCLPTVSQNLENQEGVQFTYRGPPMGTPSGMQPYTELQPYTDGLIWFVKVIMHRLPGLFEKYVSYRFAF